MLIQPLRHRFQLMADLVCREEIEYAGFSIRRFEVKRFRAFHFTGIWRLSRGLASLRDRRFGLPSMGSEE